jgi:hypothetical protein
MLVILAPRRPAKKSRSRQVTFVGAADRSQRSRLSAGDDHHRRARAGVRVVRDAAQAHLLLQGDEAMRVRPQPDGLTYAADTNTRASHRDVLDSRSLICALRPSFSHCICSLSSFVRLGRTCRSLLATFVSWVCWELAIHFACVTVFMYPWRIPSAFAAFACAVVRNASVDPLHVCSGGFVFVFSSFIPLAD